jgi:hypothetical protein
MGLGDTSAIRVDNPFSAFAREEFDRPHVVILDLMRRPENFGWTCKILFGIELAPFQVAILRELWVRPFPMLIGSRGMGKTFLLALYSMLRLMFTQGSKIVIVGSAFRQAKAVFDYCQDLWERGLVYRQIAGDARKNGPRRDVDRCSLRVGDSILVALPIGDGSKIRGQRATITIADEFASIRKDVFEVVIRGFGAVSKDPIEKYKEEMKRQAMAMMGLDPAEADQNDLGSNQTVISGSASYSFNYFCEYWHRYKAIVESRGDPKKLAEVSSVDVDWRDYSVMRIPVEALPPKYMDQKQLAQAKATVHSGTYLMEYSAVFQNDSNGFFKRSLVESCVVGHQNPVVRNGFEVRFHAVLAGNKDRRYVIAADPASEVDNFSVVVLEVWPDHRRIVTCWTTRKSRYKEQVKKGLTREHDFYSYAARKIRDLMAVFPTARVAIDSQGGGVAVIEALQAKDRLKPGEQPLLPVIDENDPKETDDLPGDHLIVVVNFASAEWTSRANHGLKKDFEDKALLFPEFDPALVSLALEADKEAGRVKADTDGRLDKLYDTLDDCMAEIEELKDELASIVHSQTGQGRERWDTPETAGDGGRKGRLRKDRYSALLMANAVARELDKEAAVSHYPAYGGFVHQLTLKKGGGPMFTGPAWYTEQMKQGLVFEGGVVARRGD